MDDFGTCGIAARKRREEIDELLSGTFNSVLRIEERLFGHEVSLTGDRGVSFCLGGEGRKLGDLEFEIRDPGGRGLLGSEGGGDVVVGIRHGGEGKKYGNERNCEDPAHAAAEGV